MKFMQEKIWVLSKKRKGFMKVTPHKSVKTLGFPLQHWLERRVHKDVGDSLVKGMWLDISLTEEAGISDMGSKRHQGTSHLGMPKSV